MTEQQAEQIKKLTQSIRSKDPGCSSLFIAMYELYPKEIWREAINQGLITEQEFVAGLIVLNQYRKLQAIAAIKSVDFP